MTTNIWIDAVNELRRRKLRTFLTLLGLMCGVASIVAMQGIGEGSRREALQMIRSLGLNNLIVESRPPTASAISDIRARSAGLTLTELEAVPGVVSDVRNFAGVKRIQKWGAFSAYADVDAEVTGASSSYFELASLQLSKGRIYTNGEDASAAAVAVLGHQAAFALFPSSDPIGQLVKVNHVALRVVGVLSDRDMGSGKFEGVSLRDDSNTIFVPLQAALLRFRFSPAEDQIDRAYFQLTKSSHLALDSRLLSAFLSGRHGGVPDFALVVPLQLFNQNRQTQRIFDIVMGSIAAISLIVGGIGIMNIMLANVLERKREIGLLRAIGARRRDVEYKFLSEAVAVSATGVIAGSIVGAILAYVISYFAGWKVGWSIHEILAAQGACLLIGIGFGVYPARQASRLDPIAAIRDE